MSLPFLTDDELSGLCDGLVAPAAQVRFLQRLGLLVQRKPNGRPLLLRSELERVLGAARFEAQAHNHQSGQPNRAALMQVIQGGKRGAQAQGR